MPNWYVDNIDTRVNKARVEERLKFAVDFLRASDIDAIREANQWTKKSNWTRLAEGAAPRIPVIGAGIALYNDSMSAKRYGTTERLMKKHGSDNPLAHAFADFARAKKGQKTVTAVTGATISLAMAGATLGADFGLSAAVASPVAASIAGPLVSGGVFAGGNAAKAAAKKAGHKLFDEKDSPGLAWAVYLAAPVRTQTSWSPKKKQVEKIRLALRLSLGAPVGNGLSYDGAPGDAADHAPIRAAALERALKELNVANDLRRFDEFVRDPTNGQRPPVNLLLVALVGLRKESADWNKQLLKLIDKRVLPDPNV